MNFLEWWRSQYKKSGQPEPDPDARPEPFTDDKGRDLNVSFMVRVFEDGQDVTDLLRGVRLQMRNGEVRKGEYIVDIGSGLRRNVQFSHEE